PGHLRFDFSHFTSVAEEELQDIEDLMNREVLKNTRVETFEDVPLDAAINEFKAMALFGEKYGERVRVVKIGDFSTELCGGIHTGATGEIGLIKIVGEGSVSSGVRRVEAVSGTVALHEFRRDFDVAKVVGAFVGSGVGSSSEAVTPAEALRARIVSVDGKVSLIVGVTKDLTSKVQAGKIVGALAAKVGGKGGGRPDLAEAGGSDVGSLDAALQGAAGVVEGLL